MCYNISCVCVGSSEHAPKGQKMPLELILASASPRRRELLGCTGLQFSVQSADVEEIKDGLPQAVVTGNARLKGEAVASLHPLALVLAADTVVAAQGRVLGKPADERDAARMLSLLSGAWHAVLTGVTLIAPGFEKTVCDVSRVHFVQLTERDIERYVKTGEPMDKAGAYALQGIAGMFVDRIEGSYSNVIGLPMALVRSLLLDAGCEL